MRNLCYFCHYHHGNTKEKIIKIAGGLLIVVMLFIWAFSVQAENAAQQYTAIAANLLPEPGYISTEAKEQNQPAPVKVAEPAATSTGNFTTVTPPPADGSTSQPAQPTCKVNGVEMPGPCANYQPKPEMPDVDEDNRDQFEQERQKQELTKWKGDRLRETKNLLREIEKVRKQFIRLKGSADEVVKLETMKTNIAEFITKVNATNDSDDLRGILEENDFGEWWQELDQLRAAVEIPKDLNNLRRDQKRAKTMLRQKWVCKLADCERLMPVIQNMDTKIDEATNLYKAGEFEDARAVIQETFHERGWYGDALGALQMMRGFLDPLRGIKNKDLKADLEEMTQPIKDLLYEGELREARETMEAVQRELGQSIFKMIMDAQKKKREIPETVYNKIEQLRQKFDQQSGQETQTSPEELAPPVKLEP